jgi:rhodanese-related sulfurtransferase
VSRPPALLPILLLAVVALVAACGSSGTAEGGALPDEVDVSTAASMQADGAFVLDVREPDEWAAGHIDGATLIPLGELEARAAELPDDTDIVVVCRSGNRSAQGRDILRDAGFDEVTSMAGGMSDWIAAGQPYVTGP